MISSSEGKEEGRKSDMTLAKALTRARQGVLRIMAMDVPPITTTMPWVLNMKRSPPPWRSPKSKNPPTQRTPNHNDQFIWI